MATENTSIILQGITPEQLSELVNDKIKLQLEDLKQSLITQSLTEDLLTRERACKLLRVDASTLWHWQKQGKIKCYGIGSRRYYKKTELMEALELLKSKS